MRALLHIKSNAFSINSQPITRRGNKVGGVMHISHNGSLRESAVGSCPPENFLEIFSATAVPHRRKYVWRSQQVPD